MAPRPPKYGEKRGNYSDNDWPEAGNNSSLPYPETILKREIREYKAEQEARQKEIARIQKETDEEQSKENKRQRQREDDDKAEWAARKQRQDRDKQNATAEAESKPRTRTLRREEVTRNLQTSKAKLSQMRLLLPL